MFTFLELKIPKFYNQKTKQRKIGIFPIINNSIFLFLQMKDFYNPLIKQILFTTKTIKQIAKENNVSEKTLSKKLKQHLNIKTIDDVIYWCSKVDDTRKVFLHKNKQNQNLWNQIKQKTDFLPKTATLRERLWYIKNNTTEPPKCICGNYLKWNSTTKKDFNTYCSLTCEENIKQANEKRIQTNLSKRGVKYVYLDPVVKEKQHKTMIKKYGNISYNKSKIQKCSLEILNNKNQLKQLYDKHKTTFKVADTLNVSQACISQYMQKMGIQPKIQLSNFEHEIRTYIENTLNIETIKTKNIIYPQEIDIFIPLFNIGFECNGIFWHSEKFKHKQYHLEKTKRCAEKNIRLIHIFENEYIQKPEIIKSRISSILRKNKMIYARNCKIEKIDFQTAFEFYEKTHIQGSCSTLLINYGLFLDDILVGCMSFSKPRYNKKFQWELIRYSSSLHTNIIGGASKLFARFLNEYKPQNVISYSDNRWNTGNMYENLGFKFLYNTQPNYFYFKLGHEKQLFSRINFQKHKLKQIMEFYDKNKTEYQIMKLNGFERIWDCGNSVWIYSN